MEARVVVFLNSFQAALYKQLSTASKPLDEVLTDLLNCHTDHPTIHSDLLYLLSSISVSNNEAEQYFTNLAAHRSQMETALLHPVDLRVALMDYFVHVQPRYISPKIIELKDYQKDMNDAMLDPLTGCLNRRSLDLVLANEAARAQRHKQSFSIMFIDIDNFKHLNDAHGHMVGDEVLCAFANFLREQVRVEDVVGRFGGEEFILLLPQTDLVGAERFAHRLVSTVHRTSFPHNLYLTFSAGVAGFPHDAVTVEDLVRIADERMYRAKMSGKDQACAKSPVLVVAAGENSILQHI